MLQNFPAGARFVRRFKRRCRAVGPALYNGKAYVPASCADLGVCFRRRSKTAELTLAAFSAAHAHSHSDPFFLLPRVAGAATRQSRRMLDRRMSSGFWALIASFFFGFPRCFCFDALRVFR